MSNPYPPGSILYVTKEEYKEELAKKYFVDASTSSTQIGGDHYCNKTIQPWYAMESWMTHDEFKGYLRGNVIKYLARCNDKGGVEDLKKARHYLDKLLEVIGE